MNKTLEILINKLVDNGKCPEHILDIDYDVECKNDDYHATCVNCWKISLEKYVDSLKNFEYQPFTAEEALAYIDKPIYQNGKIFGVIRSVSNTGFYIDDLSKNCITLVGDFNWCCKYLKFEDGSPVGKINIKKSNNSFDQECQSKYDEY